jgi:RNA polymerase sigma-B factor
MDRPLRPAAASHREPTPIHQRNADWLQAYGASRDRRRRLRWRDALVRANLPLVRHLAGRLALRTGIPFDDLLQVGCLGLIRAIEAFDPRRGAKFSTFAVPYIRGAIAHEVRDRGSLLRVPRPLWELRQRATALQEQLRGESGSERGGAAPRSELARRLGCAPEELAEALAVGRLCDPRSLDAPLPGEEPDGAHPCLLDRLAAPEPAASACGEDGPEAGRLRWLREQFDALDPQLRSLLAGRQIEGCTWVELGRRLSLHPRMAQRRHDAALERLREAARQWGAAAEVVRSSAPD